MRKHAKDLGIVSLLLIGAFMTQAVFTRTPNERTAQTTIERESDEADWAAQQAERLVAQWQADYAEKSLYTKTPIHLGFSRAFSQHFTKARGNVEINFPLGQVTVSVDDLDPPADGSAYEVWLIEHVPGVHNTGAIDLGDHGDRIISLGPLPASGSRVISVGVERLANFEVDMAAVMRVARDQKPEFVIGGSQSIRFQIGRKAMLAERQSVANFSGVGLPIAAAGFGPVFRSSLAAVPAQGQDNNMRKSMRKLIARGRDLFFNGTFRGNGRTCGTCHPANNNLTIDRNFIAGLDATDPLFVAEFNPNLPPFDDQDPHRPALEDPSLMRMRGLILENIDGFAVDATGNLLRPPVFRAVPSLFNLQFTAPYGYSACCPDLQGFAVGAVVQHFPKTLERKTKGKSKDFVLPTARQLRALEAFMLSNTSPANGNFTIFGEGSLLSTQDDPEAIDQARREVKGRDLFFSIGCTSCHGGTVLSGGDFDIGVEDFEHTNNPLEKTPTFDDGSGSAPGLPIPSIRPFPPAPFQTPQLFGLRKPHFFHTGIFGNNDNEMTIPGETLRFTNLLHAVSFYNSTEFNASPGAKQFGQIQMSSTEMREIAAFLEVISNP